MGSDGEKCRYCKELIEDVEGHRRGCLGRFRLKGIFFCECGYSDSKDKILGHREVCVGYIKKYHISTFSPGDDCYRRGMPTDDLRQHFDLNY